jgi:hypothetical protein
MVLADELERAGDYAGARDARQRDLDRTLKEDLHPDLKKFTVMMATYEHGRLTGYTCDYAEAERLLRDALRQSYGVEEQLSHRTAMPSELSRLTLDAGKPADSVDFHARALERLDRSGMEKSDPIALAMFPDSYAEALDATGDAEKAVKARGRAQALRELNPTRHAMSDAKRNRDVCGDRS